MSSYAAVKNASTEVAIFGLGCFWGPQYLFSSMTGVLHTEAGYTGGPCPTTYRAVCDGDGNTEGVKIVFDKQLLTYEQLLFHAFKEGTPSMQRKNQYKHAIWYTSREQQALALKAIVDQKALHGDRIYTELLPEMSWTPAEEHHQNYELKKRRGRPDGRSS